MRGQTDVDRWEYMRQSSSDSAVVALQGGYGVCGGRMYDLAFDIVVVDNVYAAFHL